MDGNNQGQYNGGNQYYGGQPNPMQGNQYGQPAQGQMYSGQPQMGYQQPVGGMNSYQYRPRNISKKEFFKDYADKKNKSNITSAAVMLYICFAINFFASFIASGRTEVILDCILLIAMGLCIHILYSRIAAVVTLVYGIINVIVYYSVMGSIGGILIPIAGVCACLGTFGLEKEYKEYNGM